MAASLALSSSSFFTGSRAGLAQPRRQQVAAPCRLTVRAAVVGPGKKWEHTETNSNGKPVRVPMHVRKGDTVKVIAGGDKGKVGTVLEINSKRGEVLVEGVNIKTKHVKPAAQGEQGQILKKEFPVHHSNVAVYSTAQQTHSRVGMKVVDGVKRRYLKKTGELLPVGEKKVEAPKAE